MTPSGTLAEALTIFRDEERFEEYEGAKDVLLNLGQEDTAAIPELLKHLLDTEFQGRIWIILALEQISPKDSAVFTAIAELSRDPDESIRGDVIRYLSQQGSANPAVAIPALARAARLHPAHDDVSNSFKAFVALVQVGMEPGTPFCGRKRQLNDFYHFRQRTV
jgi:HEAT repeat protein